VIAFSLRRLLQVVVTVALLTVTTFILMHLVPGGPAFFLMGTPDHYTPEHEAAVNRVLGIDQPVVSQLVLWVYAFVHGDLGWSFFYKDSVAHVIGLRLWPTIELAGLTLLLTIGGGITLGLYAGAHAGSRIDRCLSAASVVALSVPSFWLGIALVFVFAVWQRWLPSSGIAALNEPPSVADHVRHLVLPVLALSLSHMAGMGLYVRTSVAEALRSDCIRTARAKGLPGRLVFVRHALRSALIPILTMAGLYVPNISGGTVVVETVFSWPGIGQLMTLSVVRRDYPVLMGIVLLLGVVVVAASWLTDMAYHLADPRIAFN